MKRESNVRWMGVLAAACAVQLACGGAEDARPGQRDGEDGGLLGDAGRQVQATGCVERGIIPGSYLLTAVRIEGQNTAETRGTSGEASQAREGGMGADSGAQGHVATAAAESYTLRAVDGTDLGELVGQRVRVEGQLQANQAYEGGTLGTPGAATEPADPNVGMAAERPGGSMAAAGASIPLNQLAAEHIEPVEGACDTVNEATVGGDPEPAR